MYVNDLHPPTYQSPSFLHLNESHPLFEIYIKYKTANSHIQSKIALPMHWGLILSGLHYDYITCSTEVLGMSFLLDQTFSVRLFHEAILYFFSSNLSI